MLICQAQGLGYLYPGQLEPLFSNIQLSLYAGARVALLGQNGCGKSTLLDLLAGRRELQSGEVFRHGEPLLLTQEDALEGTTALDAMMRSYPDLGELWQKIKSQEASGVPTPLYYAELLSAFAAVGGYALEATLQQELDNLGFAEDALLRPLEHFSGGERRLLRLVAAFARQQTFYLLDEPTNYLDTRAKRYLTHKLQTTPACCLIVSHDRKFLDDTATAVLELSGSKLKSYRGNYSNFRAQKENAYQAKLQQSEKLTREIRTLKAQERTYKIWGARKEKEKSGAADRGFVGARAARLMRRGIQAKERLQGRIEALETAKPWTEKRYAVAFAEVESPAGVCVQASALHLAGQAIPLQLAYGERLALTGANGAGKTTLLRGLLGEVDLGCEVLWDNKAHIGYLPQRWAVQDDLRLVEALFSDANQEEARTLLGTLGIPGTAFFKPLGHLSEGQKRKVKLAALIAQKPNVIILDEPTTHLDYVTVEMLETALAAFTGTLILVTHDSYLRERTTTRELGLSPGTKGKYSAGQA